MEIEKVCAIKMTVEEAFYWDIHWLILIKNVCMLKMTVYYVRF